MTGALDIAVVGAGVFGVTAACELTSRGYRVGLFDPGPLPRPEAASTDISKVVRLEYGADEAYTELAERARDGWLRWNRAFDESLYCEVGLAVLSGDTMRPGEFEHDSFEVLRRRGHTPERLAADEIARRWPAFGAGMFSDGFYHALGGYADSGRAMAALVGHARASGVQVYDSRTVHALLCERERVVGVATEAGPVAAGDVVVAAGAWTPALVPELAALIRVTGQPVFHLVPRAPEPFAPDALPVFTADIGRTGWYGFPLHPRQGVVKLGNHGVGVPLDPERDPRVVTTKEIAALRAFLADAMPSLADAPVVSTRRCLYCDTADGHFMIARPPTRRGLVVASGGSGHAFKFAPVLGELVADAVEGRPNPALVRFGWRTRGPTTRGEESARHRG